MLLVYTIMPDVFPPFSVFASMVRPAVDVSVEVPIEVYPLAPTRNPVWFELFPIAKVGFDPDPPLIERFVQGDVVPTPTFPLVAKNSELVAVIVFVPLKYGNCPVVPV